MMRGGECCLLVASTAFIFVGCVQSFFNGNIKRWHLVVKEAFLG